MNNILLDKIKITNFKGVASFENEFDPKLTQLKGPSGSSKTTVLDAIKWCLVYPVKGWEPTIGENRAKVKDIITSIELTIERNGIQYTLQRTAEQKYKTSPETGARLEAGYDYKYYFDSPADCKAKDYQAKVSDLFGIAYDKLLYLIDTKVFLDDNQTNWADRRKWLYDLLDIDNKTANLADKEEYNLISPELKKGKSEVDIQKMLNAEKKSVSDEQERNKTIIDTKVVEMTELANIDFEGIEKRKIELNAEIGALQAQNKQSQTNTLIEGKQAEFEAIRAKLNDAKREIARQEQELHSKEYSLQTQIDSTKQDIEFCQQKIKRLEGEIEDCKIEAEDIQSETFDNEKTICPTCKQILQEDKIAQLKDSFEKGKAERLANINFKAQNNAVEQQNTQSRLNTLTERLSALESEFKALKEITVDKSQIEVLEKELTDKQIEIDNLPKTNVDDTFNEKISALKTEYENCIRELVKKDQLEKIKTEIQNLKNKSKELANQDNIRIQKQNQLRAYIEEKVAFVSTEINSHFEGITWQLFTENSDLAENKYEQSCFPVYNSAYQSSSTGEKIYINSVVNKGLQNLLGVQMFTFMDEKQSSTISYSNDNQVVELITSTEQNFKNVKISDVFGEK